MSSQFTRRQVLKTSGLLAASIAAPAFSQAYPVRTIRFICPWQAGGSTDIVIRSWAESASKILGQQIIVDN